MNLENIINAIKLVITDLDRSPATEMSLLIRQPIAIEHQNNVRVTVAVLQLPSAVVADHR